MLPAESRACHVLALQQLQKSRVGLWTEEWKAKVAARHQWRGASKGLGVNTQGGNATSGTIFPPPSTTQLPQTAWQD